MSLVATAASSLCMDVVHADAEHTFVCRLIGLRSTRDGAVWCTRGMRHIKVIQQAFLELVVAPQMHSQSLWSWDQQISDPVCYARDFSILVVPLELWF
jgi:hypothetical protein